LIAPFGYRLIERQEDAFLFRSAAGSVGAEQLLRDSQALAARLPQGRYLVNLCHDRYAFAVSLLAALIRDQVTLLSGDRSSAVLSALAADFPGSAAVVDDSEQEVPAEMPVQRVAYNHASGPSAENVVIPADRIVAIVFTSGSTGRPIAHAKTWGSLVERSIAAGRQFGLTEVAPATVVGTVPPQHMYGFETTVLLPLHAPASSWCGPTFFPEDMQTAIAAVPPPCILVTTPLQIRALLGAGSALRAVNSVISATAPLDAALAAAAEQHWNTRVLEIFGATEVGSIASRRTLDGASWSVYPGIMLNPGDDRVTVAAAHTVPTPLDDQIEMLDAAHFRLLGRRTDIVKLGGRRASLAGLNRILLELEGVDDGAFVLPERDMNAPTSRLMALVVSPQRSADSILRDLRGKIDPVFLPRRIVRVPNLPRNEFGKLSRTRVLALLGAPDDAGDGA